MKKILLILCLGFTFSTFAQADSLQKQIQKLTVERVYTDVKEGFSTLVTNLQGPAKHVYGIYVKQHFTRGIAYGLTVIFCLFLFGGTLLSNWKKADYTEINWNKSATLTAITSLFLCISIGFTIDFLSNGLMKLINPEYYAIQDIINAFK